MLVGKKAPNFETEGYYKGDFKKYRLSDLKGKWAVLLFYPLDFTFVCPTEVLSYSRAAQTFEGKNCQVFGISIDSKFTHKAWVDGKDIDPVRLRLGGQVFAEPYRRALGDGVRGAVGPRLKASATRRGDDPTAAASHHAGQDGSRAQERAAHVDLDAPPPRIGVVLP